MWSLLTLLHYLCPSVMLYCLSCLFASIYISFLSKRTFSYRCYYGKNARQIHHAPSRSYWPGLYFNNIRSRVYPFLEMFRLHVYSAGWTFAYLGTGEYFRAIKYLSFWLINEKPTMEDFLCLATHFRVKVPWYCYCWWTF